MKEGGIEHPTHLETLQQPEQQARIQWLKERASHDILDIGCSWGYILNELHPATGWGIDISEESIERAKSSFPHLNFNLEDITSGLTLPDKSFSTVILADILEHLQWWNDVGKALKEAVRISNYQVLITLPYRKDDQCALCFKHKWITTNKKISRILIELAQYGYVNFEIGDFVLIELKK